MERSKALPQLLHQYKWQARNLAKYNTIIFDCDGVLYRRAGTEAIEGAKETLHALQRMGKRLIFVSNSSRLVSDSVDILTGHFDIDIHPSQVWTASVATAEYLKTLPEFSDNDNGTVVEIVSKKPKKNNRVFLIGTHSMYKVLSNAGFDVIWSTHVKRDTDSFHPGECELDSSVRAVVVGFSWDYSWSDVSLASRYLHAHCSERPVHFVASNTDATFPYKTGVFLAATGAVVAAVSETTHRSPVVCAKPQSILMDAIMRTFAEVRADSTLMVGDMLHSDIAFANNAAMDSLLVLSGVTTAGNAQRLIRDTAVTPTFVLESVKQIADESKKLTLTESKL